MWCDDTENHANRSPDLRERDFVSPDNHCPNSLPQQSRVLQPSILRKIMGVIHNKEQEETER